MRSSVHSPAGSHKENNAYYLKERIDCLAKNVGAIDLGIGLMLCSERGDGRQTRVHVIA